MYVQPLPPRMLAYVGCWRGSHHDAVCVHCTPRCVWHRYELVEVTREKLAREVDGDVKPVVVGCVDHVPLHWHYC